MRFSLRLMLVAITATAAAGGYMRWRVEEERRNAVRFEQPGPVEDRRYWPPPAEKLIANIEERFGPRQELRLYRNLYSRRFGITDCFIQCDMKPEEADQLVRDLRIVSLEPDDRSVRRYWRKVPEQWLAQEEAAESVIFGHPYIRGGHMGSQPFVLYEADRKRANIWYVYDY